MNTDLRKFDSRFVVGTTRVKVEGANEFRHIKNIHETRKWIEVKGLEGSFQRGHIVQFTNKSEN